MDPLLPEGIRFTCQGCGDCCRNWDVLLLPGEAERLAALDWSDREPDLIRRRPDRKAVTGTGLHCRLLRRRPDGACIYLSDEQRCLIHEHFGEAAKPKMCRRYPFGFRSLAGRVAVDVSFFCKAVSRNQGEMIDQDRVRRLVRGETVPSTPDHRLTRKQAVREPTLLQIEEQLIALLHDRSLTRQEGIQALLQFNRLATMGDPETEAASLMRQAMVAGVAKQARTVEATAELDRTQRAVFYQWLFLSLNPPPHDFATWPPREQMAERKRRAREIGRFRSLRGNPLIDNRSWPSNFGEIAAVSAEPVEDAAGVPIDLFLQTKILGQKFLTGGTEEMPLVEAIPKLCLTFPMTIWTAKALAAERSAPAIERPDVERALRLLDRTYGQIDISILPKKQRKAFEFILFDTQMVEGAMAGLR